MLQKKKIFHNSNCSMHGFNHFVFHHFILKTSGPQPFWHQGLVLWRKYFHRPIVQWWGGDLGMIPGHIYCALCFYYCYLVIYNEITIQLTIIHNHWKPSVSFPATGWSHLGITGVSDTQSVLLKSSLLHNLVLVSVTADNLGSERCMHAY